MIALAGYQISPIVLPPPFVSYLMLVCDRLKISISSLECALSLTVRFLKKRPHALPLQLVGLSSLHIASKFIDTNLAQLN